MGMGPMAGMNPQMLQQLMQAIAQQGGGQGGPPQGQPPGGGQSQPMPQLQTSGQQPQQPQFQTGRSTMQLPGGTASPSIPGIPISAMPPKQPGSTRASGIAAIPGAVFAAKQKMQNDKVQKAAAIFSAYLAKKQNDDPTIQKEADQMMTDPKTHKIFAKALDDPTSAEYQGAQLAYRHQMSQEQQKVAMQEMKAKMQQQQAATQHQQALARQADAQAAYRGSQTETIGEVTPAMRFQAQQKKDLFMQQLQMRKQFLDQSLQQSDKRLKLMKDIAEMKEGGLNKRTGMRATQIQAATALYHQATGVNTELRDLIAERNNLESNLDKSAVTNYITGTGDEIRGQIAQLDDKIKDLTTKAKTINESWDAMQASNLIPKAPPTAATTTPEGVKIIKMY